ncbi:MAG: NF038129 family PEP-CTERM protein [Acidobacteriaceae bacterium]|nr:NF038129 family PEP-CTERM protein [Acidobacteriaceae bacterium]MBV9767604.1 NF038129 family PEP-CTERM protein [Acidobacteriaceae bacterium]
MTSDRIRTIATLALGFSVLLPASAGPISYAITVNTSSITGTAGSLDFNFNPGPLVTQAASLQILNFSSDGTLASNCPCGTGDVSGQLPATITFDNGAALNDYFDDFKFGSTLSFNVSLYGPALTSPNGSATSGSAFAFSMFSDPAGTIPVLTTDTTDGFAVTINVNLDGTTTVTNYSTETSISTSSSTTPEPMSAGLIAAGTVLIYTLGRRSKRYRV